MTPYFIAARNFLGERLIADKVTHRVPPRWRRMRSAGGKIVKDRVPATTKEVPIYDVVFVDTNKRYAPNGKREVARRLRQMAARHG